MEKKVNKKYKDTVFRMLFGKDRNELLKLYNAVNGTDHTNADELTINTLEDALYVSMKNDVSFVFQDDLNLYEHQSTDCPNIPLRDLFYVADLLQEMTVDKNIYGTVRMSIPAPHFIVFYNGTTDPKSLREYRLSEMFSKKEKHPQLELIVRLININEGQNNKVLRNCKTLQEYSKFVGKILHNLKTMPIKRAVPKAVNDCIEQGILREFLMKHKARVIKVSIYEYNEKKQRELDREEGREEGLEEGRKEERANTERERKRADEAEQRADSAEQRAKKAENDLLTARDRIAELEAALATIPNRV